MYFARKYLGIVCVMLCRSAPCDRASSHGQRLHGRPESGVAVAITEAAVLVLHHRVTVPRVKTAKEGQIWGEILVSLAPPEAGTFLRLRKRIWQACAGLDPSPSGGRRLLWFLDAVTTRNAVLARYNGRRASGSFLSSRAVLPNPWTVLPRPRALNCNDIHRTLHVFFSVVLVPSIIFPEPFFRAHHLTPSQLHVLSVYPTAPRHSGVTRYLCNGSKYLELENARLAM